MIALYVATLLVFFVLIAVLIGVARLSGHAAVPRCGSGADCACHARMRQGSEAPAATGKTAETRR